MKKAIYLLMFCTTFVVAQTEMTVQNSDQLLNWQGKAAVGGYSPQGTLKVKEATLKMEDDRIDQLDIIVDMKSLEQENTQLRDHLRNEDFFHVAKFPTASFSLTEPCNISSNNVILKGIFTIRGVKKTENIAAEIVETEEGIQLKFKARMNRTEYNIKYNSPSFFKKLKENAIDDYFTIEGELNFSK